MIGVLLAGRAGAVHDAEPAPGGAVQLRCQAAPTAAGRASATGMPVNCRGCLAARRRPTPPAGGVGP